MSTTWPRSIDAAEIDQRVDIRLARQEILAGDDPARLVVVLDEAALRRSAGGEEVMRDQVRHLITMAGLPRVSLQVIPFGAGTHAGTQGPFTILEFPDHEDPDAVYVETVAGELFVEEPLDVDRFRIAFEKLTAIAASPADTITLLERILEQSA